MNVIDYKTTTGLITDFRVISETIIKFKFVDKNAKLPLNVDAGSSGYDLYSVEEVILNPGEIKLVSTGLIWEPPSNNYEMQIRPRSGLALKHGITVLNSPGTVDASYRDIIKVILINHSQTPYTIKIGDRIAQAVFAMVLKNFKLQVTDRVNATAREGGFGSTDKQ